jgi:hypothetical protein
MTEGKKRSKPKDGISRREFLKDASLVVGGAAIGSSALLAASCSAQAEFSPPVTVTTTATQTVEVKVPAEYEAVSPLGTTTATMITQAPRLSTLQGKTICEISNHGFKSEVTFPVIEALLKKQYSDIKIVPYSEFPDAFGLSVNTKAQEKDLLALIKEKGCDAILGGNGG